MRKKYIVFVLIPGLLIQLSGCYSMQEISKDEMIIKMANDIPLKRLAKPEEIASAVVYLASEIGGYVNGQTIVVDGGLNKSTY